ncbi:MAG: Type secretion system protein, partial [Planctomycetota bacterium]
MNPVSAIADERSLAVSAKIIDTIDSSRPGLESSAIRASSSVSDEARHFAEKLGLPVIDLRAITLDPNAVSLLPARDISRRQVLPYGFHESKLLVAISETCDIDSLDEIRMRTNRPLELRVARREELHELIKSVVGLGGG